MCQQIRYKCNFSNYFGQKNHEKEKKFRECFEQKINAASFGVESEKKSGSVPWALRNERSSKTFLVDITKSVLK